jgi:dipeptidyl aminopeptidase/acylaminoacyl peptidase
VTNLDAVPAASTNNDVFTLRLDEPGARPVKVSSSPGSDDGPAYSPDGKWLAFRSQARAGYESDKFRLMLYDREPGGRQGKESAAGGQRTAISELMPKFDNWVDELAWAPDSKSIYFASGEQGEENLRVVSLADGTIKRLTSLAEVGDLHPSPNGTKVVLTAMTAEEPTAVVAVDLTLGMPIDEETPKEDFDLRDGVKLTHLNDALLAQLTLWPMETFWFKGAEDAKVQGFLIRPPGFDAAKTYPVKFLIHGGPQGAWGDSWSYRWNAELMAASGYVVVMVNPRGSVGYGQKFVEGVSGDWGGKPYIDLMRGLDAAEAKYPFIDKTRECALGASYGGYMADWILTHTNRFNCIVTHDGMYDAESAYGATEEMWFNEWEFRRSPATGAATFDTQPAEPWRYAALPADQDPFRKFSPMRFIKNAKTPTLVIHSQRDYRLDVSQGFELFTALQRLGVPSKFLYFPDEGHWVLKPKNSELWYETVGDWCDRWTHSGKYAETK